MSKLLIPLGIFACLLVASESGLTKYAAADVFDVAVDNMQKRLVEDLGNEAAIAHRRSLLQSGDDLESNLVPVPNCIWDAVNQQCGLNPLAAAGFLNETQPQSDLRDVVVDVVSCGLSLTEDICGQNQMCKWFNGTCNYVTDVIGRETIAQCIGEDAAVFLEANNKQESCETSYKTPDSCNIAQDCSWVAVNETTGVCGFDVWKFLTGVASDGLLPRGLSVIMERRAENLAKALREAKGIRKAADVLDWDRPPFFCPEGVDLIVCKIAEKADQFLVTELYCAGLVAADEDCDSDKLCSSKSSGDRKCSAAPPVRQDVQEAQREAYLSGIFSPTAAILLRTELSCLDKSKKECSTEKCSWDSENRLCSLSVDFMMKKLAEHPAQQPGPMCQLVKGALQSGCLQIKSETDCTEGEDGVCEWDARDGICTPGVQVYMNLLFAGNENLERQTADAALRCKEIEAEDECK